MTKKYLLCLTLLPAITGICGCSSPWGEFPEPAIATCNEELPEGVPELYGYYATESVENAQAFFSDGLGRSPVEALLASISFSNNAYHIEQCGMRIVITGGSSAQNFVIHDMIADGTLENGVDDPANGVTASAVYEGDTHVLNGHRAEGDFVVERRMISDDSLETIFRAAEQDAWMRVVLRRESFPTH